MCKLCGHVMGTFWLTVIQEWRDDYGGEDHGSGDEDGPTSKKVGLLVANYCILVLTATIGQVRQWNK